MLCEVLPKSRNAEVLEQLEAKVSALKKELSSTIEGAANTLSLYLNTKRSPEEIEERKQALLDDLTRVFKEQDAGYSYVVVRHLLPLEKISDEVLLDKFKEMVKEIPEISHEETSLQRKRALFFYLALALTQMSINDSENEISELTRQQAEQKDVLQQANSVLKLWQAKKKQRDLHSAEVFQEQAYKEAEGIVQGQQFLEKWAEILRLQKAVAHIEELITANERNFSPNMMANEVWPTGQVISKKQTQALRELDRLAAELKQ